MMRSRRSCPRPTILSEEFSRNAEGGGSLRVLAHLETCASCQGEWAAMTELRNLSRSLPRISTPATVQEEVRTALLLDAAPAARGARLPRALWMAIPVAVGAAAVMLLAGGKKTVPPTPDTQSSAQSQAAAVHRARVHSDDGAAFTLERAQPDEIVRLRQGSIVLDVEPLKTGERFRIVVGDAEIEVRGTVFHVVARADRLEGVDVWRGVVLVRPANKEAIELGPGGRWEIPGPEPVPVRLRSKHALAVRPPTSHPALSPSVAEAAFGDGWKALRAENFAEAAAAFERASAAAGGEPLAEDAWFWKAVCEARMGYQNAASASLAAFIDRFPRSPRVGEASAMLGWILIDQEDLEGAAKRFASAAKDRVTNVRQSARTGIAEVERLRQQAVREGSGREGH